MTCYTECDTCKAFCSNGAARAIKDSYICSFGQPTLGIAAAVQISDAGQHIVTRHGSQRTKGRSAIPEDAWLETFDLLVNNNVDSPRVPRNSVSCRKEHRESTNGKFVPHLDDEGNPILRSGFMVRQLASHDPEPGSCHDSDPFTRECVRWAAKRRATATVAVASTRSMVRPMFVPSDQDSILGSSSTRTIAQVVAM